MASILATEQSDFRKLVFGVAEWSTATQHNVAMERETVARDTVGGVLDVLRPQATSATATPKKYWDATAANNAHFIS